MGKKDVLYIVVIILLLFIALSSSGLLPISLPFVKRKTPVTIYSPVIITHTKVVTKTSQTPKTGTKHTTLKTTIKSSTTHVKVVTKTVTATLVKTRTLTKTKTEKVTESLTTTLYITVTKTKIVKVPYYPKEPFKTVIQGFVSPGDVIALNLSSKYVERVYSNLPLFYSLSPFDVNVKRIGCEGGVCEISNSSFDNLGKSLILRLTTSKAIVATYTSKSLNVSNGILYVFMFIPDIGEYIKSVNNLTMRIEVKEPRLLSPVIYIYAEYVSQGRRLRAVPILFKECEYGWYLAEFKVSGVGINEVDIVFRNFVAFIKSINLDKIVLVNTGVDRVKIELEPPVGILHDLISNKTYKPVVCDDICVYRVPISWSIVIETSSNYVLSKRVINTTYTVVINKQKGEILSITPTREFLTFTENISIINLLRDIPGILKFIIAITPH